MSLTKERIHYLLEAYINKRATAEEESELMDWVLEAAEESELKNFMLEVWNQQHPQKDLSYVEWDKIYSHAMQQPQVVSDKAVLKRMNWYKLTAAAVILVVLATGAYFYMMPDKPKSIASQQIKATDIAPPASNKAVLTLADGSKIEIDTSDNGTIALQGNVRITKQPTGEIGYAGTSAGDLGYNTLQVPRGSNPVALKLSDGSRVWLNVGSSLTYPAAFTGKERKVQITGEAYFEIARNEAMPFMVQHNDVMVTVLGTHFNVNSYDDEAAERITLLEGSVRVSKKQVSQILKPGQQASVAAQPGDIKILSNVDVNEVMAWKEGKFRFGENTDIGTIMRQISRWYNVEVEYKGGINQRFWGSISKNVKVSQVLRILEATGGVKFKIEEKKIIVMPASS